MKTWNNAEIEVLDVKSTAYGSQNPDIPDGPQITVVDDDGNVIGYRTFYGENVDSKTDEPSQIRYSEQ